MKEGGNHRKRDLQSVSAALLDERGGMMSLRTSWTRGFDKKGRRKGGVGRRRRSQGPKPRRKYEKKVGGEGRSLLRR